jgi:hypothetical protein
MLKESMLNKSDKIGYHYHLKTDSGFTVVVGFDNNKVAVCLNSPKGKQMTPFKHTDAKEAYYTFNNLWVGLTSKPLPFITSSIWTPIDRDNLPDHEVLAANFKEGSYGYKEKLIGYLEEYGDGIIGASSQDEVLENITHFIDLKKHDL